MCPAQQSFGLGHMIFKEASALAASLGDVCWGEGGFQLWGMGLPDNRAFGGAKDPNQARFRNT